MADEDTEDIILGDNEPAFLDDADLAVDDIGEEDLVLGLGDEDVSGFSLGGSRQFEE